MGAVQSFEVVQENWPEEGLAQAEVTRNYLDGDRAQLELPVPPWKDLILTQERAEQRVGSGEKATKKIQCDLNCPKRHRQLG